MNKLSVYIITLNEEKRIEKTLLSCLEIADEIIVVDSGSSDKTEEICKKYNCKFIYNKWISYCEQKHFAQEKCSNNYVLMLDADEFLPKKLISKIKELKKNNFNNITAYSFDVINMNPKDIKPRLFAFKYKNLIRLYNKNKANLPKELMNKDRVKILNKNDKVIHIKYPIFHYCFLSITDAVDKYNRHSSELLKTAIKNKKKYTFFRLIIEFPRQFIKYYFIKRFFIYGSYGFIQAMILAYFRFLKIAKIIAYWNKEE